MKNKEIDMSGPNIDPSNIDRILIIQFRPFGDVLLATSYLETLKKHLPHAEIDFLVKRPYQEVLDGNPYVSKVIAIDQDKGIPYLYKRIKLFFDIRRKNYHLVIDQQNGTGSGQLVLFSGATYKLGWETGKWSRFYNLKAARKAVRYRALQNFDMLEPLGIREGPVRFFFQIKPESDAYVRQWLKQNRLGPRSFVLISPGSPRKKKKWDARRYAALTDLILSRTGMKVVLLRAPGEVEDCRKVVEHSLKKPLIAPPTTFNQAAALVKSSRLLICNDGGVNHLSVALEAPSLAIFGNTSWRIWSPQEAFPNHYHLVNPAWRPMSDNSFGITPEEAFEKVLRILADIKPVH